MAAGCQLRMLYWTGPAAGFSSSTKRQVCSDFVCTGRLSVPYHFRMSVCTYHLIVGRRWYHRWQYVGASSTKWHWHTVQDLDIDLCLSLSLWIRDAKYLAWSPWTTDRYCHYHRYYWWRRIDWSTKTPVIVLSLAMSNTMLVPKSTMDYPENWTWICYYCRRRPGRFLCMPESSLSIARHTTVHAWQGVCLEDHLENASRIMMRRTVGWELLWTRSSISIIATSTRDDCILITTGLTEENSSPGFILASFLRSYRFYFRQVTR